MFIVWVDKVKTSLSTASLQLFQSYPKHITREAWERQVSSSLPHSTLKVTPDAYRVFHYKLIRSFWQVDSQICSGRLKLPEYITQQQLCYKSKSTEAGSSSNLASDN